ncbi:2-phosphosulfolactate phosphatase [Actinomycetospora termitidis]|uniref:Probable 2-phosphosulfolactate phosphatase n=1 Tax=Actinomycetospora termitidis TaxID=3053470 RepID=A0ABT7M4A1_9PSEU|nr:2-phosphosulfolactate phosphatase [Actinomycetospora sp. Odt1-22]MDL5155499.1 2-phosphosulfolactate phosphatase [Actinomycetospora sp. Odt1-22]
MTSSGSQAAYRVRCEWGPAGGALVARGADVAVVVDVCSFTTATSVALDRGMAVIPSAVRSGPPGVVVAGRRSEGGLSLSPGSIRRVDPVPDRIVLPSPNGSSISAALAARASTLVAACLRNASAVGAWLAARPGSTVAVVPAGERWSDGGLRPAVEDLWGAGAILSTLVAAGVDGLSPEARVAVAAFEAVRADLGAELRACISGRELIDDGFADDVEVAAELDASDVVPVLVGGEFRAG